MSSLSTVNLCGKCNHPKDNHKNIDGTDKAICNASIECPCEKFEEQTISEFFQLVEAHKAQHKTIYSHALFLLEKLPFIRNAGEKSFYRVYLHFFHGFTIKKGTILDNPTWNRLPNQDTVNREKRRVKQKHPEYATYDPNILRHQTARFQAYLEDVVEEWD